MAKELPYYKHEPSEWLEGEIQVCSDEAIVCFINLCSGYWLKLGCISFAFALQKYCRKEVSIITELINNDIISLDDNDKVVIKFLDTQLSEFKSVSEKRSKSAKSRWDNANALQVESKSNAIREEKRREEEIKQDDILLEKETKDIIKAFDFKKSLIEFGVSKEVATDWMEVRRKKKASNTETAFKTLVNEINKTGRSPNECITEAVARSWQGFKSEWMNNTKQNGNTTTTNQPNNGRQTLSERMDSVKQRATERRNQQINSQGPNIEPFSDFQNVD